jgi:ribosomal protein L37E
MALLHESCGEETVHGEVCSACGQPLAASDMSWSKPWFDRVDRLVGPGVVREPRSA